MLAALPAAPPSLPPAIVREVEEAVTEIFCHDDLLVELPLLDDEDQSRFNSCWLTRTYNLLNEHRPDLGCNFVRWYVQEEAAANREGRSVRAPHRFRLRYPVLRISTDGHVHIET